MYIKDVCDRYNIFILAASNSTTFSSTPISAEQINNTLKMNEELAEILEDCQSDMFNYTALSHNLTSENVVSISYFFYSIFSIYLVLYKSYKILS